MPLPEAKVHGVMTMETESMPHGIAGPRFLLRNRDDRFDVVVCLPETNNRDEPDFTIPDLPSGSYDLFHHLSGKTEGVSVVGWGGTLVELPANGDIDIGDLAGSTYGSLEITLLEADGTPLDGATLSVVDPMWEAWDEFSKQPTTAGFASKPIAAPPRAHVVGGPVTLPNIRAGRLHLRVENDDGRVAEFYPDVDPTQPLTITMPR